MIMLDLDVTIGEGMWQRGWHLEASLVEDGRYHPWPYVTVHAYRGSQCTRGSVTARVVYDDEARRSLAEQRLQRMMVERDELDREIEELHAELAHLRLWRRTP